MPDNKIELEIMLRDAMSPVLQSISSALTIVNSKLLEGGSRGIGALSNAAQQTKNLGDRASTTTKLLANMDNFLVTMSKSLLSPAGIAAGFVAVAKSLDKFATGQLNMRNFALNTGLATSEIHKMYLQASRAGIAQKDMASALVDVTGKLNDLMVRKTASPFWAEIAQTNRAMANRLVAMEGEGRAYEKLMIIVDAWARETDPGVRRYYEQITKLSAAHFKALTDGLQGAVRPWQASTEAAVAFERKLTDIYTFFGNIGRATATGIIISTEPDAEKRRRLIESMRPKSAATYMTESYDIKKELEAMEPKKEENKLVRDIRDIIQRLWGPVKPKQFGGPVLPGKPYLVGEHGPELFSAGGKYQLVGEGGPEIIRPTMAGQIKAFAGGGLLGLAEQYGYTAPAWMKKSAEFLGRGDVQYAMGFMHAGLGGASAKMHALDMALDTATAAPNEWPRVKGLLDKTSSAADTDTIDLSAMRYKGFRRSENIADTRPWWEADAYPPSPLPGPLAHLWRSGGLSTGYGRVWDRPPGVDNPIVTSLPGWVNKNIDTDDDLSGIFEGGQLLERRRPTIGPLSYELGLDDIRSSIDRSLGAEEIGGPGSLSAEINFRNVPPGVKTIADGDGFDNFQVNKTKQLDLELMR